MLCYVFWLGFCVAWNKARTITTMCLRECTISIHVMEFYTLTQFNAYSHLLSWTIKQVRSVCHMILEFEKKKKSVIFKTRLSTVSPFVTQLKKRRKKKKCLHLLGQKKKGTVLIFIIQSQILFHSNKDIKQKYRACTLQGSNIHSFKSPKSTSLA